MFAAVFAFLKLVSPREWLIIGASFALMGGIAYWNHRERAIGREQAAAKVAAVEAELLQAQSANADNSIAIDALRNAIAQCESGRVADKAAQAQALKDRDAAQAKLTQDAAVARTKLQALLAGRCKSWADQPACGVTQ